MTKYFILILSIFSSRATIAQTNHKLDSIFTKKVPGWLVEYSVPAVGIGIIENGKITYEKVFGELQKGVPAPDNTIFNVASITKTVVVMLTLKLVEQEKWNLDEPLSNYWIDPDVASDPLYKKLTTRHVLTHQTGFANWRWDNPTKKLTFDFEPGTKFKYSGEGFEYLRHALENKFRKPIDRLTDSLLFKPLEMKDTRQYWDSTFDESRFAAWHEGDGKKYELSFKTGVGAADDLLTTVKDYSKFGVYIMNGAGLSKALFKDMITPQSNIQEHNAMGLGWFIIKGLSNGEYAIYHNGSDYGVNTIALFLPKSKRGIVVFTNGDNGISVYNNVIKEAFDIGNNLYECLYDRPNIPKMVQVSDETIKNYVGRYQHPDGKQNIISMKENEIILSGGRWPKLTFHPQAENKFFVREFDVQVEFIKDQTGEVSKMIIYQNGNKYAETIRVK